MSFLSRRSYNIQTCKWRGRWQKQSDLEREMEFPRLATVKPPAAPWGRRPGGEGCRYVFRFHCPDVFERHVSHRFATNGADAAATVIITAIATLARIYRYREHH